MPIYEITPDKITALPQTTFAEAGLFERGDLQRLLREQIEVVAPDTLVIAEEFGDWQDSRRRIDLLAVDRDANLIVIELKRTEDGGHMELQALRYAAMVSTMTFERAGVLYARFLDVEEEDARSRLLEFFGWDGSDGEHFAPDVRIILVSADFSQELTTAVLWLNKRDLDIRCVRLRPHRDGARILLDVAQVSTCVVRTDGKAVLWIDRLLSRPALRDGDAVAQFRQRVASIPGVTLTGRLDHRPRFPLSQLAAPGAMEGFESALDELVTAIRSWHREHGDEIEAADLEDEE